MDELEDKRAALTLSFKWTDEYTRSLIRLRGEKKDYFTGKRNAARSGWDVVLMEMGLSGIVSVKQAKKKWDNLVHRYKELKNSRICANEDGDVASTWPFYQIMDEALGNGPLVTLPVVIASLMDGDHSGEGSNVMTMQHDDTLIQEHLIHINAPYMETQQDAPNQPPRKKRKKESDDAYLDLLRQSREDWLRMHNTLERQGERMINMFNELVKSITKK